MLKLLEFERHAKHRCRERYGREYDEELKTRLVREIKRASRRRHHHDGPPLKAFKLFDSYVGSTKFREVWNIHLEEGEFKVAYNPRHRAIITFLR